MKLTGLKKTCSGIAMTEYLILLAIIAVAAILVIGLFGKQIKQVFTENTGALAGQSVSMTTANMSTSKGATKNDTMGTFDTSASKTGQ